MTCVAAVANGKTVWMMGDAAAMDPETYGTLLLSQPKVFLVKEFLIGGAGSCRVLNILEVNLSAYLGRAPAKSRDPYQYMVKTFVESYRKCLRDCGIVKNEAGVESTDEVETMVGFRGRIFVIASDFSVIESTVGEMAIGSGADLAKGALAATRDDENPTRRLGRSLEAAAEYNAGVRKPFTVMVI